MLTICVARFIDARGCQSQLVDSHKGHSVHSLIMTPIPVGGNESQCVVVSSEPEYESLERTQP